MAKAKNGKIIIKVGFGSRNQIIVDGAEVAAKTSKEGVAFLTKARKDLRTGKLTQQYKRC